MAVKRASKPRSYDARARSERARQSRERVIAAARRAFMARGYAGTTIVAVARDAGVSAETVYKAFGGKPGLVRAVYERALAGRTERPAPERSDAMSAATLDPRVLVHNWGTLTAEVSPLVSPILLLVRAAAATDPELVGLLHAADEQRLERMRQNTGVLAARGHLRADVSPEEASAVMWACTSPELYELLVLRRGWTAEQFGRFVGTTLESALLPPTRPSANR